MAADNTAIAASTDTLTAATVRKINLTGRGNRVELIHHAAVTAVVYYGTAVSEATLPTLTAAGDECRVLLPGERLQINVGRVTGTNDVGVWINLLSSGAAVVSCELVPGGA